MHPRYFFGISLPAELSARIEAIRQPYHNDQNLLEPLVPHITLLHPGILTSVSPMFMVPKVKQLSEKFMPIEITLNSIAMFEQRVLYISVDSPELLLLQHELVEALPEHIRSSYDFGKTYTPHVTIAQAKPMQSMTETLSLALKTELKELLPFSFTISSVDIFKQVKPRQYSITPIS